ncbi:hypothetical protein PIB30_095517, partial [Stylosanthes scabra]|nr:hypothetical protein [Stylosanthes scabra]
TPRICVEEHAYAYYIKPNPRLGKSITLRRGNLILSTHMRRSPRICVGNQQAHIPSHAPWQQATTQDPRLSHSCVAPNFTRPTHMRRSPRICVESSLVTFEAHVWEELKHDLTMLAHSRATHMRRIASICVEGKLNFQVNQAHVYALKQAYAWRPSKLKAKL